MFLLSRGGVHQQGGPCFFFREGGAIGMGGPLALGGGGRDTVACSAHVQQDMDLETCNTAEKPIWHPRI